MSSKGEVYADYLVSLVYLHMFDFVLFSHLHFILIYL